MDLQDLKGLGNHATNEYVIHQCEELRPTPNQYAGQKQSHRRTTRCHGIGADRRDWRAKLMQKNVRPLFNDDENIKNHLTAYSYAMEMLKVHIDSYFKRIQFLMVAIQIGLLVAMGRYLSSYEFWWGIHKKLPGILIPVLGVGAAAVWILQIGQERKQLEFCRSYMRNLEAYLTNHGVKADFFKQHQKAFFCGEQVVFEWSQEVFQGQKRSIMKIDICVAKLVYFLWLLGLVLISVPDVLVFVIGILVFCTYLNEANDDEKRK